MQNVTLSAVPIFRITDISVAKQFYMDLLGFRLDCGESRLKRL